MTIHRPSDLIPSRAVPADFILVIQSDIMSPASSSVDSSDTSLSDRMDEWISRQHTMLVVAQETQLQSDQHKIVENDAEINVNYYVLYTPPMGRGCKLLPKHRGPYQVRGRKQSIYFIEDVVLGKQIITHVHNLRLYLQSYSS
jgi:hypothetical protein